MIDVSGADTIRVLSCCNELGICYINSALENEAVDQDDSLIGFQLTERYTRFEKEKEKFTNTKSDYRFRYESRCCSMDGC